MIIKGGEGRRFRNVRLKRYYPVSSGEPRRGCLLFIMCSLAVLSRMVGVVGGACLLRQTIQLEGSSIDWYEMRM